MANPSLPHDSKKMDWSGLHIECAGLIISDVVVTAAQQAAIANVASATAAAAALTGAANAGVTGAANSAITASTAPAGGTGDAAGAYDNASNRDLMIASLTATQVDVAAILAQADKSTVDIALILAQADKSTVDVAAQKVELDKLITDVGLIRTKQNAILVALEDGGILADA